MMPHFLECETCGAPLRELSPADKKIIAMNPQNFIIFCSRACERAGTTNV